MTKSAASVGAESSTGEAARLVILRRARPIAGAELGRPVDRLVLPLTVGAASISYSLSGSCPVSVTSAEIEPSETRNPSTMRIAGRLVNSFGLCLVFNASAKIDSAEL